MFIIHCNVLFILFICTNFCFCEIESEQGDKYLNGFVNFLNSLPRKPYIYENGVILNAQHDGNTYKLETKIKATNVSDNNNVKYVICSSTIKYDGDHGMVVQNDYHCNEEVDDLNGQYGVNFEDTIVPVNEVSQLAPIHLDNEVQPSDAATSGEQFVAVPREQPAPCIGCATHVDPKAEGVTELAELGIKHLDRHEPSVKHVLQSVIDVERQVQVVNGVRYILTLQVSYNNCESSDTQECNLNKVCKITVLEKPWMKLPSGSKYRAILANNCTEEWQFGDDGEVVSQNEGNEVKAKDDTNDEKVEKINKSELGSIQNNHNFISDEELKQIQIQIIPLSEFDKQQESDNANVSVKNIEESVKYTIGLDSAVTQKNSEPQAKKSEENRNTVSVNDEKKKAIDDLMNFFNFDDHHHIDITKPSLQENTTINDKTDGEILQRKKRGLPGGKTEQDPSDIKYKQLAEESLEKYVTTSGSNKYFQVLKVTKVTTQVVAGSLTNIEFDIGPTSCGVDANGKPTSLKCDLEKSGTTLHCKAEIWERAWLNKKDINVTCEENNAKNTLQREKRGLPGGKTEQDPSDVKYKQLAEESLEKYVTTSGTNKYFQVLKVAKVTTQVVAGQLTNIEFDIGPTTCGVDSNGKPTSSKCDLEKSGTTLHCKAEIWERAWLNKKDINVTCEENNAKNTLQREKRGLPGGKTEQDPSDVKYKQLAEESLEKYVTTSGTNKYFQVLKVAKVTTQVVAGQLTNIEFDIGPTTCGVDSNGKPTSSKCDLEKSGTTLHCKAEIWERAWLNKKDINITCEEPNSNQKLQREKRRITGGKTEQDPSDIKYKQLAEESLEKYVTTSGTNKYFQVLKVTKVTTQVVAGSLTNIEFDIGPTSCGVDANGKPTSSKCDLEKSGNTLHCKAEIWERAWLNKKDINVTCEENNARNTLQREKRELPGGKTEQDPSDIKYKQLAEESLEKYVTTSGTNKYFQVLKVTKVTTQVVAGSLTNIEFDIGPTSCGVDSNGKPTSSKCDLEKTGNTLYCKAEIWERTWLNKKDIDITCEQTNANQKLQRKKRTITGGKIQQNTFSDH